MANLTIFGLVQLTSAGADLANDLVPVWDNDALETKKMTLSDLRNLMSPVNWSDSFSSATQATSSWTPNNAAANVNAAIIPKGTGAITAAIPDGTTVGGNARGTYAVDLQMSRSAATQVAGGANSFIGSGTLNTIISGSSNSAIVSGSNNQMGSYNSFIGGGSGNQSNTANNSGWHVICGGNNNRTNGGAGHNYVSILGGDGNNASGTHSTICGGSGNSTTVFLAGVFAGSGNTASGAGAFIGGGSSSTASGERSVIGGGWINTASGAFSTISGGWTNGTSGGYAAVGGGLLNSASGSYATISGGTNNLSQVYKGSVGGGGTNTANAFGSVGGGFTNVANSNVALGSVSVTLTAGSTFVPGGFIGGNQSPTGALITGTGIPENTFLASTGPPNIIMSNAATSSGTVTITYWNPCGTVAGGRNNTASGIYSTVVGGQSNTASSNHTFIGGGSSNGVSGTFTDSYSLIVGGFGNGVSGNYDVLVGGRSNAISGTNNGNHRFIGGGSSNFIGEQSLYSIIVGGETNSIVGRNAFIGGGGAITMTGGNAYSVIGGGQSNTMSGSNTHMVIGGGLSNTASAGSSVVSGGSTNTASGVASIITGGFQGVANLYGQQAHASGRFSTNGDAQAHELIWRRAITGTAQTELFLDGTSIAAILPGTNSVWNGIIDVTAICTVTGDGTTVVGHVEATSYKVTIKRIGTTTSLVGGVQEIGITNADASMSTSAFTIDNNDTNESLRIQFTPPATAGSTTVIRAIATFRGQQIQY